MLGRKEDYSLGPSPFNFLCVCTCVYARVISILTSRNIVTDELDIEEMWKVYQEVIKGTTGNRIYWQGIQV